MKNKKEPLERTAYRTFAYVTDRASGSVRNAVTE